MHIIFLGPPGSGKGTQSELIINEFKIPHISTGDMFREAMKQGTPAGIIAKQYVAAGNLVPDEVTIAIVKDRIQQDDCKHGYLLDGFPRTIAQAEALEKIANGIGHPVQLVLNLVVADEVLLERISGRRICKDCGASYHIRNIPPKVAGICDKCGGELIIRKDDNPESVKTRIETYHNQTEPLIGFYEKRGIIKNYDALIDIDILFDMIKKDLKKVEENDCNS